MTPSLIALPMRVGLRGAQLGLQITAAVTDLALGVVGAVADATSQAGGPESGVDLDGQPFGMPAPPHISTEANLVSGVPDVGAENGAGATIRVGEPWPGYDKLRAVDIVKRISSADVAELGAIELYEQTGRKRQTVLTAVARALRDTSAQ